MTLSELIAHYEKQPKDEVQQLTLRALKELKRQEDQMSLKCVPLNVRNDKYARSWHWTEHNYEEKADEGKSETKDKG